MGLRADLRAQRARLQLKEAEREAALADDAAAARQVVATARATRDGDIRTLEAGVAAYKLRLAEVQVRPLRAQPCCCLRTAHPRLLLPLLPSLPP